MLSGTTWPGWRSPRPRVLHQQLVEDVDVRPAGVDQLEAVER